MIGFVPILNAPVKFEGSRDIHQIDDASFDISVYLINFACAASRRYRGRLTKRKLKYASALEPFIYKAFYAYDYFVYASGSMASCSS